LGAGAGTAGLNYTLVITQTHIRVELSISTSSKEKNKLYLKKLHQHKDAIEQAFGSPLIWQELAENKMSRIKFEKLDVNVFDENDWPTMNDFFVLNLPKFEKALQPFVDKLK